MLTNMEDLKLALIQTDIYWENIDANLAMLEEKLWSLQDHYDIILLPEAFNAGFTQSIEKIAEVPGLKTQKWLQQMASQKKSLIGGSYLVREGQNIYNRFVAALPNGNFHFYDKRHLFKLSNVENKLTPGENRLIITYKGWRICPMICYDLRFPVWSRNKVLEDGTYDFDLLIYSANWPGARIESWDALLMARAIENQCYVAGVNRVGEDQNELSYPGHSGVYAFCGRPMKRLEAEEAVLEQQLNYQSLVDFRAKLPFLKDEIVN